VGARSAAARANTSRLLQRSVPHRLQTILPCGCKRVQFEQTIGALSRSRMLLNRSIPAASVIINLGCTWGVRRGFGNARDERPKGHGSAIGENTRTRVPVHQGRGSQESRAHPFVGAGRRRIEPSTGVGKRTCRAAKWM
jgi:hypothetical protein